MNNGLLPSVFADSSLTAQVVELSKTLMRMSAGQSGREAHGTPSAQPPDASPEEGRCHILLVEDNPMDVFLVRQAIAAHHLGAELQILADGEAAIRLITRLDATEGEECSLDLIMLDLNLPRANGFEILKHLRGSEKCATVPVILMTSSRDRADRTEAASLGANMFFCKPSDYNAFMQIGIMMRQFVD